MDISKLTNDQRNAYQEFINFLLNPNQSNLIIQGSAGTGKTFLTKYLIEEGINNYKATCVTLGIKDIYSDYAVTATTNKAVEALEHQITLPNYKSITTITSFLGLHVAYNPKLHKQTLMPNKGDTYIFNQIIFIDECSMINEELFSFINQKCNHCKIIYIGDKYQLPPVKEKISPIYTCNYPEIVLNQPVRNAGNQALVNLCSQLKDTCETGIWNDIHSVPGSIEVIKDGSEWQKIIDKEFLHQDENKKILAYSNNLVTSYAEYIMQLRGETDYLVAGSWYTSNAYYINTAIGNQSLHIDSPILVKEVNNNVHDNYYQLYKLDVNEWKPLHVLSQIKVYSPILGKTWTDITFSKPEYYQQYMKSLYKSSPRLYYEISNQTLDLRKVEASTVHKAQGSTLDTVFIDLDDISKCTQKQLTAKLLYVAASRARKKIIFFGELAKRYGVTIA